MNLVIFVLERFVLLMMMVRVLFFSGVVVKMLIWMKWCSLGIGGWRCGEVDFWLYDFYVVFWCC